MPSRARIFELLESESARPEQHPAQTNSLVSVDSQAAAGVHDAPHRSPIASPGQSGIRQLKRAVAPADVDELVRLQEDIDALLYGVTAAAVVVCIASTLLF